MLLYITVEDVLGAEEPERSGPRSLAAPPRTLAGLYDHGLRHHERKAVMLWPDGHGFEPVPDWKLDRTVIRIALYCREKLGLEPGSRAVVFGRLGWLWPAAA